MLIVARLRDGLDRDSLAHGDPIIRLCLIHDILEHVAPIIAAIGGPTITT